MKDPFCLLVIGTMINNNGLKNVTCKQGELFLVADVFGVFGSRRLTNRVVPNELTSNGCTFYVCQYIN